MKIQIEWAIKTKLPDDQRDYRVLACSKEKVTEKVFEELFRKWQCGEMPLQSNDFDPGAPWLTFAPLVSSKDEKYYYLVLRERWTDISDSRNRRIKISECLIFPFQDIANAKMSLFDLVPLLDHHKLTSAAIQLSEGKIPENVSPISIDNFQNSNYDRQILETIKYLDFAKIHGIASQLTSQPVALLTAPNALTLEDRIAILDAVLGLLPYGMRAKIPLTTWVQRDFMGGFRLNFCRSSSDSHISYVWSEIIGQRIPLSGEITEEYAESLSILKKNKDIGLKGVVEHLSTQTSVLEFGSSELLKALESLDRTGLVYAKATKAPGCLSSCLAAIRNLFFSEDINNLSKNQIFELLSFLIKDLSQEDIQIFENYGWSKRFDKPVSSELERALDEYSDDQDHFDAILELVVQERQVENLFSNLMKTLSQESEVPTRERREENLIHLINSAIAVDQKMRTDTIYQWVSNERISDHFFYAWAIYLYGQAENDTDVFQRLLQRESGRGLVPLRVVWGMSERELTHEMIDDVFELGSRYVGYLFRQSIDHKTLDDFVIPFVEWLLLREERSLSQRLITYINQVAYQEDISYASWAALDIIRLAMSSRHVLLRLDDALTMISSLEFDEYSKAFIRFIGYTKGDYIRQINRNLTNYAQKGALSLKIQNNITAQDKLVSLLSQLRVSETGKKSSESGFVTRVVPDRNAPGLRSALASHSSMEVIANHCVQIIMNNVENIDDAHTLNEVMRETARVTLSFFRKLDYPNTSTDLQELLNHIYRNVDLIYALGFERFLVLKILNTPYFYLNKQEIARLEDFERKRIKNFRWYVNGLANYFPDESSAITKVKKIFRG